MRSRVLKRRFLALLGLAFLFAQIGALTHAYSHLPDSAGARQACGECLSFAPLLAAAGASDHAFHFACGTVYAPPCPISFSFLSAFTHPGFRSRAPPVLA
jgi:hypothetical protein